MLKRTTIHPSVHQAAHAIAGLGPGVIGILLCDSQRHVAASARRMADQGVGAIIAVGRTETLPELDIPVVHIADPLQGDTARDVLNALFASLTGRWVLWLWNGEFLYFPFGETRSLDDLTEFLNNERRKGFYAYAIDLYAPSMPEDGAPADWDLSFDRIGYHAFPRPDQQLRLYGGLGWRFEELTPPAMQPLGRTALLKVAPGVQLDREMLFGQTEYDSVSCPWHHSTTGAVMTMRRAHRILAHPNFPPVADNLMWLGSVRFQGTSRQLLELGMIEPGQWF